MPKRCWKALRCSGGSAAEAERQKRMRAARPVGEWDAIEIVSRNGTVQTFVNGTLVSTFSEHDYPAGQIGMQTEGAPVVWRNLRVKAE